MTPLYYRNRAGKVAVSLDDGATVVLPTGRVVELDDAWSGCDDDLLDETTPEQRQRVALAEAQFQARRDTADAADTLVDDFNRERNARGKGRHSL